MPAEAGTQGMCARFPDAGLRRNDEAGLPSVKLLNLGIIQIGLNALTHSYGRVRRAPGDTDEEPIFLTSLYRLFDATTFLDQGLRVKGSKINQKMTIAF